MLAFRFVSPSCHYYLLTRQKNTHIRSAQKYPSPPHPLHPHPFPSEDGVVGCDGTQAFIVADLPILAHMCAETRALLLGSGHKNEKGAFGFDLLAAQSRFYGKGSSHRTFWILSASCHFICETQTPGLLNSYSSARSSEFHSPPILYHPAQTEKLTCHPLLPLL